MMNPWSRLALWAAGYGSKEVLVSWSTDVKNVLDVWAHMPAKQRVALMEAHPELYTALTNLSHENDHLIMQAQRQFRQDAINLKVGALRQEGAHVPEWMTREAAMSPL